MRDYLHQNEIDKLLTAARASPRYGQRNHLLACTQGTDLGF